MKKLSARRVQRLLIIDHNSRGMILSQANLRLFEQNPVKYLRRFITIAETRFIFTHWRPNNISNGSRWQCSQDGQGGSISRQMTATVFLNAQGTILIEFIHNGKTINGEYYAILDRSNKKIKAKWLHLTKISYFTTIILLSILPPLQPLSWRYTMKCIPIHHILLTLLPVITSIFQTWKIGLDDEDLWKL